MLVRMWNDRNSHSLYHQQQNPSVSWEFCPELREKLVVVLRGVRGVLGLEMSPGGNAGKGWQEARASQGGRLRAKALSSESEGQGCDPMNCSMPGFPVLHYLLEFVQTHVY